MKKIIALSALFLMVFSSTSFAAALASGSVTTSDGLTVWGGLDSTVAASATAVLIGKTSNGVYFGANYTNTQYAIATKHTQGTKSFGTAHDSTAIFTTEVGTGALSAAPSASTNAAFASWTEM